MSGSYEKREVGTQRRAWREDHVRHERRPSEDRGRVIHLQAKGGQGMSGATRTEERARDRPQAAGGASPPDASILDSGLQN